MNKRGIIVLAFLIVFSSFTSAISIGNLSHSIEKIYPPNGNIRGWINISFSNKNSNSLFQDSFDNSIRLMNLLDSSGKVLGRDYTCVPTTCINDYSPTNEETRKSFFLTGSQEKIIGFKINGKGVLVDLIEFTLNSDAQESNTNQIKIDFLNNDNFEEGNYKKSSQDGNKMESCFNSGKILKQVDLGGISPNKKHCQRIKLSEAPAYKVGAWIKTQDIPKNVTFVLYDKELISEKGSCKISLEEYYSSEVSCEINYPVLKREDYFICIYAEGVGKTPKIRGYEDEEGCGFYSVGKGTENAAYEIFAISKKFGSVGNIIINDSKVSVHDYLTGKYGVSESGADCSSGCIIPVRIKSFTGQSIELKNLSVEYSTTIGSGLESKSFYDLVEIPPKVTSKDFLQISLNNANFSVPFSFGNKTYEFSFDEEEIFSEKIFIENVPKINHLFPLTTFSAFPTNFHAIVEASYVNGTIVEYFWEFGDNKTKTTNENKVEHTYNSTGEYSLKLTIRDSKQKTSYRIFSINVLSAQEAINFSLEKKLSELENLKKTIEKFSEFERTNLNSIFEPEEKNRELKRIQTSFLQGGKSESEYNQLLKDLLEIKIPESLIISDKIEELLFYPEKNLINLDALKSFGGGNYETDKRDLFLDTIILWNIEKIETKISSKNFVAFYENEESISVLKILELKINENEKISLRPYLIIKQFDNLRFQQNYGEVTKEEFVGIQLESFPKEIIFATTENINLLEPNLFISPVLERLEVVAVKIVPEEPPRWIFLILIFMFLFFIFLTIYIILQEWYKRRYETYLFKDRNNLFNLVIYIETSKKKNLSEKEIYKALKKAGWNSEQIDYALKKHSGKRTGMFEIPGTRKLLEKIENLFKKKKIPENSSIVPRQGFYPRKRF
jgi:PKD repeat protein